MLAYAHRAGEDATAAELAAERAAFKSRLAARRRSIDDFMKAESLSQADLDRQLAWNVVWRKYVARYATEERSGVIFCGPSPQVRRHAIGGQPHPAPAAAGGAKTSGEELLKQAAKIRKEIIAGEMTFAEAARKYSAGPSRKDGGRLGLIGRHGPMDEAFSRAAFALNAGEVSPPVKTPFGVDLIRCDEIKPGDKQLADVRKELEDAVSQELLDKLAGAQRERTPVEYTGLLPHFKPGTHELEPAAERLP